MSQAADRGANSFGERLRESRQRRRGSLGRRWTQGELAAAVGVERNTVSRWENGGVLPKDPAVLAALARVLHVSADWLLGGFEAAPELSTTTAEGAGRLREGSTTGYRPDATELAKLPPAVAEVVRAYLQRLAAAGCTTEQLAGAESALLGGATNSISRRAFDERSDAEIAADVDAAWDFVSQVLRREGIRP